MSFVNDVLASISQFTLDFIQHFGYTGVFVLSFLESSAIPIPSEIVVPFSGFLASKGVFDFWGVVFITTFANLGGSMFLYWIGRSGGRWILERYGKYVFVKADELKIGDRWFMKYGTRAVFFGRMLPVVRTFISLPAGVARMDFWRFSIFTFLGALPWNFALAYVGVKTGENWRMLHLYFQRFNYVVVGAIIFIVVWYIWRQIKSHHG